MYLDTSLSSSLLDTFNQTTTQLSTLETELATGTANLAENPSANTAATEFAADSMVAQQDGNNLQQGSGMLQTVLGGMQSDVQIVEQLQSLAIQASQAGLSESTQTTLQTQMAQLLDQINTTATMTYNGISLAAINQSVYTPSAGAVIQDITAGADEPPGFYSVALTPTDGGEPYTQNDWYMKATLYYQGQVVATGSVANPYPNGPTANTWDAPANTQWTENSLYPYLGEQTVNPYFLPPSAPTSSTAPYDPYSNTDYFLFTNDPATMSLQFAQPTFVSTVYLGGTGPRYSNNPMTLTVYGQNANGTWASVGYATNIFGPLNLSITPGDYTALQYVASQPTPNVQYGGFGFGPFPSLASVTINWSSVAAGFGTSLGFTYNPLAFNHADTTQTATFQVLPQAKSVGGPVAAAAVSPALLSVKQLGLDGISLASADAAQSTLPRLAIALQILSGVQDVLGSQSAAIGAGESITQAFGLAATQSQATLDGVNLPKATAQLAQTQWLAQTELQTLVHVRSMQQALSTWVGSTETQNLG